MANPPAASSADGSLGEEWFDVVDASDRVVDRALRADVHRLGLRHRAVHLWVVNRGGAVFLQKRSRWKDTAPGLWDSSASGHLDSGEDYLEAVMREAREELGLELSGVPREVLRERACAETGQEFVRVYLAGAEGPFTLPPEEIETGGWYSPDAVDRWIEDEPEALAPSFRHLWTLARAGGVKELP